MYVEKTKALISCAVTAQLICFFIFPNAKSRFSHDAAQIIKKTYASLQSFSFKGLLWSSVIRKVKHGEKQEIILPKFNNIWYRESCILCSPEIFKILYESW